VVGGISFGARNRPLERKQTTTAINEANLKNGINKKYVRNFKAIEDYLNNNYPGDYANHCDDGI